MPCEGIAYTLVESQDLMDGFEKDKNDLVITFDHFRTKGEQMKQKLRECSSNAKRNDIVLDYSGSIAFVERQLVTIETQWNGIQAVLDEREDLLTHSLKYKSFEMDCKKVRVPLCLLRMRTVLCLCVSSVTS